MSVCSFSSSPKRALTLNRQDRAGYRASYPLAAHWLRENTAEDATIATIEIGVIGYHSDRPIFDTQGLISLDMTDHQLGWDDTLVYALNAHQPDYALALPSTAWDIVTAQWWFKQSYQPVEQFAEATLYGRVLPSAQPITTNIATAYPPYLVLDELSVSATELALGRPLTASLAISVTQTSPPPLRFTTYLVSLGTFERFAMTEFDPFENLYPSHHWQKGDHLQIPIWMEIPDDLPWGAYQLGIILHNTDAGTPLGNINRTTELDVALLTVGRPNQLSNQDLTFEDIDQAWANGITLKQLGLPDTSLPPGASLPLQFSWDTTAPIERNWTYFIHIVDEQGQTVTQLDQRPWNGRWPTTAWKSNQPFYETVTLSLPANMPSGSYSIRLGFYIFDERLPLAGNTADFLLIPDAILIQP